MHIFFLHFQCKEMRVYLCRFYQRGNRGQRAKTKTKSNFFLLNRAINSLFFPSYSRRFLWLRISFSKKKQKYKQLYLRDWSQICAAPQFAIVNMQVSSLQLNVMMQDYRFCIYPLSKP